MASATSGKMGVVAAGRREARGVREGAAGSGGQTQISSVPGLLVGAQQKGRSAFQGIAEACRSVGTFSMPPPHMHMLTPLQTLPAPPRCGLPL